MSRYIYLYKFAGAGPSMFEDRHGERPGVLGTLQEVQTAISSTFSGTDWSNPNHGVCPDALEFIIGIDEPIQAVAVGLPTSDSEQRLLSLCRAQNWRALDPLIGRFLK